MAHVRKQIRDAFVDAVTGLATTGGNVTSGEFQPHVELPALCVYSPSEDIEAASIEDDPLLQRTLTMFVILYSKRSAGADDEIDQALAEVETAIGADVTFGGLAKNTALIGLAREDDGGGDMDAVRTRLTYTITYFTQASAPGTAL